jgi:hypothetical protein
MTERNISSETARASQRGSSASTATADTAGAQHTPSASESARGGRSATNRPASTAESQTVRRPESHGSGIVERVREKASAQLASQKDRAVTGLGGVAQAVRKTTESLRDQRHETLAGYVDEAASQIERLSQHLQNKDLGELVSDAQRLARRQPALFVGSAFAIGLFGARFFRSSSQDPDRRDDEFGGSYRTESEPRRYSSAAAPHAPASTGSDYNTDLSQPYDRPEPRGFND